MVVATGVLLGSIAAALWGLVADRPWVYGAGFVSTMVTPMVFRMDIGRGAGAGFIGGMGGGGGDCGGGGGPC